MKLQYFLEIFLTIDKSESLSFTFGFISYLTLLYIKY